MELGNSNALNAITPVRRGWQWWLRAIWWVRIKREARRGNVPKGLLMDTSMINSAGWSLLRRVPAGTDGREPHTLKRPYLLFEANFSGALPGYLEVFSFVNALGLRAMWQAAYDFPNPAHASRFFEFVKDRKLEIDQAYSAYPEATTSLIRAALVLEREIAARDAEWRDLPAVEFARSYRKWLPSVQTIRDPPGQTGKTWSFTTVSIIDDLEGAKGLVAHLTSPDLAIGEQDPSPHKTQFARITIADRFLQSWLKNEADHDPTSYLMFSTWFDATAPDESRAAALQSHLHGLHSHFGGLAEDIWGCCRGYGGSGPEYFHEYLTGHEVPMGLPFSTFPGRKVEDVQAALALAGRFSRFVVRAQDWEDADSAEELQYRWGIMVQGPAEPDGVVAEEAEELAPQEGAEEPVGDSR